MSLDNEYPPIPTTIRYCHGLSHRHQQDEDYRARSRVREGVRLDNTLRPVLALRRSGMTLEQATRDHGKS